MNSDSDFAVNARQQALRKRMGIEPTKHRFGRFIGFEDRGGHQTSKRFLKTPAMSANDHVVLNRADRNRTCTSEETGS